MAGIHATVLSSPHSLAIGNKIQRLVGSQNQVVILIPMLSHYVNVKSEKRILYFKQQNWLGILTKNILLWRLWCTTDTYNSVLVSFPGLQCTHPPLCSLDCNDNNKRSSISAYHYQCKLKNKQWGIGTSV